MKQTLCTLLLVGTAWAAPTYTYDDVGKFSGLSGVMAFRVLKYSDGHRGAYVWFSTGGDRIVYNSKEWPKFASTATKAIGQAARLKPGQSVVVGQVAATATWPENGSVRIEAVKDVRKPGLRFTRIHARNTTTGSTTKDATFTLEAKEFKEFSATLAEIQRELAGH